MDDNDVSQLETTMYRVMGNRDIIKSLTIVSVEGENYRVRYTPKHVRLEPRISRYGIICHTLAEAQQVLKRRMELRLLRAKQLVERTEHAIRDLNQEINSQS
jgi:hypothetical protein